MHRSHLSIAVLADQDPAGWRFRCENAYEIGVGTKVRLPRRVEVFTGVERRRDWSDQGKMTIVAESLEPGVNASALARSHDVCPHLLLDRATVPIRRKADVSASLR